MDPNNAQPVGFGSLKVSHRKLDAARSTEAWPVHTHLRADYAPLVPGEVVQVELGLNPSSALIRKGHRLRVDIQPISPTGMPSRSYDLSYHEGATNAIYTGPEHKSYIQLPILPA
jgi:predicted acyl esterase